jgi:hypothetical protein
MSTGAEVGGGKGRATKRWLTGRQRTGRYDRQRSGSRLGSFLGAFVGLERSEPDSRAYMRRAERRPRSSARERLEGRVLSEGWLRGANPAGDACCRPEKEAKALPGRTQCPAWTMRRAWRSFPCGTCEREHRERVSRPQGESMGGEKGRTSRLTDVPVEKAMWSIPAAASRSVKL